MRGVVRILLGLFGAAFARADVVPAALFTEGMILQRDQPVPVWGAADAGERVTVAFKGQTIQATAGRDGRWIVYLEPLSADAVAAELVLTGRNRVVVPGVLVGEVWLGAGEWNMEAPVARTAEATREIAAANFPLVRHVKVERQIAELPAGAVRTTGWQPATPQHVAGFSAVGYFFARELHQKLGVPVGIINVSVGGAPIEAWLSQAGLASNPALAVASERWQRELAEFPIAQPAYEARLAEWTAAEATVKARGAAAHAEWVRKQPRPRAPRGRGDPATPTGVFNGMIHPLLPHALRGVLWYQGESNVGRAAEYRALFPALITSWREHFAHRELPFFWVNLPNFKAPADPSGVGVALLREAQTQTIALPATGQALAIDLGEPDALLISAHREVARRLALIARKRIHGMVVDDTGPTLERLTREGSALRIHFSHAEGGLLARDKPVQSLEIAGADRVFRVASGRIERDTLVVSAPEVKQPVAARYAWRNAPEANLYNGAGLPAVPFRTDDW
jgi:sialate O-acetylesterase